jgi:hypothetical protein
MSICATGKPCSKRARPEKPPEAYVHQRGFYSDSAPKYVTEIYIRGQRIAGGIMYGTSVAELAAWRVERLRALAAEQAARTAGETRE